MSNNFIPVSPELVAATEQKIKAAVGIPVEQFINLYNQKIIAQQGPGIKELVAAIVDSYKNVKEVGGQLAFTSVQEVYLNEILNEIAVWPTLAVLRRELGRLIEGGELKEGDVFAVTTKKTGEIYSVSRDENGPVLTKLETEKLWHSAKDLQLLLEYVPVSNHGEFYTVKVSDVFGKDDSWITDVHQLLLGN